jgi:uncharacterized protein YggE
MQNILRTPIVTATWIFVLLFAILRFGPTIPLSVSTQARGEPFTVSDTGSAVTAPDTVVTSFGINETADNLLTAQSVANQKSQTLVSKLKSEGVEDRDIKTTSYNVNPEYDYRNEPAKIVGYRVSITYSVKVRNFGKVNSVINAGTQAGANSIGGISLSLSDEKKEELLNEARAEALDKAKKKGESLARLAGLNLGRIINVSEGTSVIPTPQRALTDSSAEKAGGPIPEADIQAGESEVNVTVSISWEVR